MYNLLTCGELHTLEFTSKYYSNTDELLNKSDSYVFLNNNSKKTRSSDDKKGEFKIKSNARIIKLDTNNINEHTYHTIFENPDDIKNIFELSESNDLRFSRRMQKILQTSKSDGVYITERMTDKLKEHYPQHHKQIDEIKNTVILVNKSLIVNKDDYVKEKVDRAFTIGKDAKDLYTMVHTNNAQLRNISWDDTLHGLEFKEREFDTQIIDTRTNTDITYICKDLIRIARSELNNLYSELQKDYPEIKDVPLTVSGLLAPDDAANYVNVKPYEFSDKEDGIIHGYYGITVSPSTVIKKYFAFKNADFIPDEVKNQINMMDLVKATFYHEVGHALNNDFFRDKLTSDKYITTDPESPDIKCIKSKDVNKLYNAYLLKEKQATDFALKQMKGNQTVMYSLGASYSTYHYNKLRRVKYATTPEAKGQIVRIAGQNLKII